MQQPGTAPDWKGSLNYIFGSPRTVEEPLGAAHDAAIAAKPCQPPVCARLRTGRRVCGVSASQTELQQSHPVELLVFGRPDFNGLEIPKAVLQDQIFQRKIPALVGFQPGWKPLPPGFLQTLLTVGGSAEIWNF